MVVFDEKQHRCRLCGNYYSDSDMSEEHYPARNTGNEDVVAVDLGKMFNLMNFPKHSCFEMTNLFDILKKNYKLVEGVGESGGYHAQVFMSSLFSQMDFS